MRLDEEIWQRTLWTSVNASMMAAKRTLLITGGSGYLGRHLTVRATDAFQVYTTYIVQDDVGLRL